MINFMKEGEGGVINVCSFYFWRRTQSLPHEEEGGSIEHLGEEVEP